MYCVPGCAVVEIVVMSGEVACCSVDYVGNQLTSMVVSV